MEQKPWPTHHLLTPLPPLLFLPTHPGVSYIDSYRVGQDLVNFEAGQIGKLLISPGSPQGCAGHWPCSGRVEAASGPCAVSVEGNVAEIMMMQEASLRCFLTPLIAPFLNLTAASLPFLNYISTHIQRHTHHRLILSLKLINYPIRNLYSFVFVLL